MLDYSSVKCSLKVWLISLGTVTISHVNPQQILQIFSDQAGWLVVVRGKTVRLHTAGDWELRLRGEFS